jgi:sigma-B regulation protein RsbU (phosphoserine phosphatase)
MTVAYIIMISAACLLAAMAIESLLRSLNTLNFAASLLLFLSSVITLCLGLADYFILLDYKALALLVIKIRYASMPLAGYAFLLFAINFPKGLQSEKLKTAGWVVLVISLLFAAAGLTGLTIDHLLPVNNLSDFSGRTFESNIVFNRFHYLLLYYSLFLYVFSSSLIAFKYRKSSLIYQRKQVRYFFSGFLFFSFVQVAYYFTGNGIPLIIGSSLSAFSFVSAGSTLLYSIIVYRFVNLRNRLIILLQNILIGVIVSIPIVFLLYINRIWFELADIYNFFMVMVPALVLFFWLYALTGNLIRKILKINYIDPDMTEVFLDKIVKSLTITELAKNIINSLTENINCRNADFLIFDRDKEIFKVLFSSSGNDYSISAIDTFFRYVNEKTDIYDREQINFDPRFAGIKESAEKYFKKYEASLLVPFYYDNDLIALLPIAGKIDNTSYVSRELSLISKLKKTAQVVLHNIILIDKEQEAKLTKRDLILASNIQESIFQNTIPVFTNIDVYAFQKPARGVSGDYFLIEKASNNSLGALIADVSGKGFSAALVSMIIHTITKSQEFSSTSTNSIVSRINDVMTSSQNYSRITKTMSFATVFCGFFDNNLKTLFYTNAGHYPVIVYDMETRKFEFIKSNGKPAGIFPEETYLSRSYHYETGKIFVLYSDGITEAINSKEEEFSQDRLLELIKANDKKTSREITDEIIGAVENYADSAENLDDMTLIVIKL